MFKVPGAIARFEYDYRNKKKLHHEHFAESCQNKSKTAYSFGGREKRQSRPICKDVNFMFGFFLYF
jgi:hypothetical protein